MSTLRRQRKKLSHQFLAERGFTVVSHSRSRHETEILFQILINQYAEATKQNHQDVFNNIANMFRRIKERHANETHAQILKDSKWERNDEVREGSLCYGRPASWLPQDEYKKSKPNYESRTEDQKPDAPKADNTADD